MKSFQVEVGGVKELQELVVNFAINNGYKIGNGNKSDFIHGDIQFIQFNAFDDNLITYSTFNNGPFKPEIHKVIPVIELFKSVQKIVKLNDKYIATVTKDSIKVGCQTFPISILKELNDAVESLASV